MNTTKNYISIFLADDDDDDCFLFRKALSELPFITNLTIVGDGEKLITRLMKKDCVVPDVVFLDLNMPRKNGNECLVEIRRNLTLVSLPIIILSTSFEIDEVKMLYNNGALYYMRKPYGFFDLQRIVHEALNLIKNINQIKNRFLLQAGATY